MATRNRSGKSLDSIRGGGHTTALLSLNSICRLSFAAGIRIEKRLMMNGG